MRILFTSTAGLGHLLPLLALAGAASAAGHSVRVSTPAKNADRVLDRNLAWHELVSRPRPSGTKSVPRRPTRSRRRSQVFGRLNPRAALPGIEALVRRWPTRPRGQRGRGVRRRPGRRAGRAARGAGAPGLGPGQPCGSSWPPRPSPSVRLGLGLDADPTGRATGRRRRRSATSRASSTAGRARRRHPGPPPRPAPTGRGARAAGLRHLRQRDPRPADVRPDRRGRRGGGPADRLPGPAVGRLGRPGPRSAT